MSKVIVTKHGQTILHALLDDSLSYWITTWRARKLTLKERVEAYDDKLVAEHVDLETLGVCTEHAKLGEQQVVYYLLKWLFL